MVQLRKIGNSRGLTIPKKLLDDAGFTDDQEVTIQAADGQITLTKADATHERAMAAHALCKGRYGNTLTELAK